jgi:hypothetical protein
MVRIDAGVILPDHQDSGVQNEVDAGRPVEPDHDAMVQADASEPVDPNALSYARDILPLMEEHCTECHHPGRQPDLSIMPGDRTLRNFLAERILARGETNMPPSPRDHLSPAHLDLIRRWKLEGANP